MSPIDDPEGFMEAMRARAASEKPAPRTPILPTLPQSVHVAELLSAYESCHRRAFWLKYWERHRLTASQMVQRAVLKGVTIKIGGRFGAPSGDFGTHAGEEVMELASSRGLELADTEAPSSIYRSVIDHAAIADIVASTIRKPGDPAWIHEQFKGNLSWTRSAYMDAAGTSLRRFLPVSSWSPDRARYETRSWFGLGQVCQWKMPMQMVVAVMGPARAGRRQGHWSKALLHPRMSNLRFKLRKRGTVDNFKETWIPVRREEHAEISREKWLQAMLDDGVLQESLFIVKIEVPGEIEAQSIRDLQNRQLDQVTKLERLPEKQMSTCGGPLVPCPFLGCCWGQTEATPSEEMGFDAHTVRPPASAGF